jgi:hypothetical protein
MAFPVRAEVLNQVARPAMAAVAADINAALVAPRLAWRLVPVS